MTYQRVMWYTRLVNFNSKRSRVKEHNKDWIGLNIEYLFLGRRRENVFSSMEVPDGWSWTIYLFFTGISRVKYILNFSLSYPSSAAFKVIMILNIFSSWVKIFLSWVEIFLSNESQESQRKLNFFLNAPFSAKFCEIETDN